MSDDDSGPGEVLKLVLTAPALNRLIAGDKEVEVSLGHQVVKACVKKHLETILTAAAFQEWSQREANAFKAVIANEVGEHYRGAGGGSTRVRLHDQVVSLVKDKVMEVVNHAVGEAFDILITAHTEKTKERLERTERANIERVEQRVSSVITDLDGRVARRINQLTEDRVNAEVARRLAAATAFSRSFVTLPATLIAPHEASFVSMAVTEVNLPAGHVVCPACGGEGSTDDLWTVCLTCQGRKSVLVS